MISCIRGIEVGELNLSAIDSAGVNGGPFTYQEEHLF